jgi:uncharacterized protein (TIGR02646 family)
MTRLRTRGPAPPELKRKQKGWTKRWLDLQPRGGDWATTDAKRLLCEALLKLSHGKCAYCEEPFTNSFPQIDHYLAKVLRPDLAFEWTNLLPACEVCNTRKRSQDHEGRLLNPGDEDPEPFLWLDLNTGKLEPNPRLNDAETERARATIDEYCDLNRATSRHWRYEFMRDVMDLIDRAARGDDVFHRFDRLLDPRTKYKFVLRWALEIRGRSDLAQADRDRFHA